jgi:hypothetical protein
MDSGKIDEKYTNFYFSWGGVYDTIGVDRTGVLFRQTEQRRNREMRQSISRALRGGLLILGFMALT